MENGQGKSIKKIQMNVRLLCLEDAKVQVKEDQWASEIYKLLSVDLIWEFYFVAEKLPELLAARLNIGKFEFLKFDLPYWYHSNTDCINSYFKVAYPISVNCRFYFPWRNRTLSVWDSKVFRREFREVLNSGHGRLQFAAYRVMFYTRSIISLGEPQHIF